jgi:crossover junction endodeoxyribonuclease RuvC
MATQLVRALANNRKLRVLGVDPAVAGATGFGVIEIDGGGTRLMHFGAWKIPSNVTFAVRLREIHFLVSGIVQQFAPDAVAVESVFTALNAGTALKLAEVRGVVLLAAAQAQIPAHSYSPREVKANVTGYGGASKQQVQQMVKSLLGLAECPEPTDAADALAVALCHAQMSRARERLAASVAPRRTAIAPGIPANLASNLPSNGRSNNASRATRISIPRAQRNLP